MQNYARVVNNKAIEIVQANSLDDVKKLFVTEIANQFQSVPSNVQSGWILTSGTWAAPTAPVLSKDELKKQARMAWESYVLTIFSVGELQDMALKLGQQKSRAIAVYQWIATGKQLVFTNYYTVIDQGGIPATYDFTSLGQPPFNYDQVNAE